MDGSQEVAADTKEILNRSVHREKPLHVGSGFEPAHLALPLPGRLVGDFCPIVRVLVRAVDHGWHHGAASRWGTAQLVGDQSSRDTTLPFQQLPEESDGRPPIAPRLDEDVDDVAVLVHGPPQILLPPVELDEELVQMPRVAHAAPAASQPASVVEPERPTPLPNRLIRHGDPAFGEEIFDISETQAEPVSRPGELHPQPLVERYVSLSTHTAPIRRTTCRLTHGCVFIRISSWRAQLDTDKTTRRRPFAPSPLQRFQHYYERLRPSASHRYSGSCGVTT